LKSGASDAGQPGPLGHSERYNSRSKHLGWLSRPRRALRRRDRTCV